MRALLPIGCDAQRSQPPRACFAQFYRGTAVRTPVTVTWKGLDTTISHPYLRQIRNVCGRIFFNTGGGRSAATHDNKLCAVYKLNTGGVRSGAAKYNKSVHLSTPLPLRCTGDPVKGSSPSPRGSGRPPRGEGTACSPGSAGIKPRGRSDPVDG